jgi:hypothetical protein
MGLAARGPDPGATCRGQRSQSVTREASGFRHTIAPNRGGRILCQRGAYWRADRPVLRALTDKRMTLIAADADVHPEGERCITIQPGHLSAQLQSALQVVRRALESPAQSRRCARQSWPAGQDWRAEQVACPFARHAGPAGCRRGERLARARGRSRSGSGIAPGAGRRARVRNAPECPASWSSGAGRSCTRRR